VKWGFFTNHGLKLLLMRRIYLFVLSTSLLASGALGQRRDDPASWYAGADVVFTGRLEKVWPSPGGLSARFEIMQRIKGKSGAKKDFLAQLPAQSRCHAFEENHSYLVYGRKIGNQMWVDPCEGSKLLSLAEPDLRYIHSINPEISEQCNRNRLAQLAKSSRIVATAEVVGTEDSLGNSPLFRPWCGLAFTTEDAYYRVVEVLKGEVNEPRITVEHVICWDTVTVGGYSPALSPELFNEGNILLLFLKPGSHRPDRQGPPQFPSVYEDTDENCGAVKAGAEATLSVTDSMRATPEIYKYGWLDEDVDCLIGTDGEASCAVLKN
jgi:hypothetical protein